MHFVQLYYLRLHSVLQLSSSRFDVPDVDSDPLTPWGACVGYILYLNNFII